MESFDVPSLRREARTLFARAPFFARFLASFRPLICPFEEVLSAVPEGTSVLDVGCGQGFLLNVLALHRKIASGVGFEASEKALALARQAAQDKGLGALSFVLGDKAEQIPAGPFDVVMMIDVLHHVKVEEQESVLQAAAARVRPGGLLIYKDMAARPLWCAAWNILHDLVLARQLIHGVPIARVEAWAQAAGLAVARRGAFRRFAYAHDLLVMKKIAS